VKRGILAEEKSKEGRSRIVASIAHTELRDVGIIIEAASEKLEIKKAVFRELSAEAPDAILATNTSALSIAELSKETGKPERVVGLHFFNPVSRMKLVEVVVGDNTSDATRDTALAFARQVGKLPVVVRDRPGFLINRVLFPYLLDASELYDAGMNVLDVDRALTGWGMPMGPLRLIDEIGVDITIDIAATLEKAYGRRDKANELLHKMRQEGLLGRKAGSGFYKYEGKAQTPNESLEKWRRNGDKFAGDVAERLMLLMINEAARCLEEGVIASAEDADYGMVLGTGFPPFRGGPLRVAEAMGLEKVVQRLEGLARGDQKFAPCESLKDLARTGAAFYNGD
jgi:3-hydroxyacyl-CoA dehydrogenase/enoyl-CoA hydratase/3-hydroxybutyryl-CoA epimerase